MAKLLHVIFFLPLALCSCAGHDSRPPVDHLGGSAGIEPAVFKESSSEFNNTDNTSMNYHRAMLAPSAAAGAATLGFKFTRWTALYYLPNRILDLLDIFRADVGIGVSYGAVLRLTKYGQMGYRGFSPYSLRIGIRGLKPPAFIEKQSEYGIGPGFRNSRDRPVTVAEVGLGADLVFLGGYLGLSLDELADFLAGFFFIDFKRDDLTGR